MILNLEKMRWSLRQVWPVQRNYVLREVWEILHLHGIDQSQCGSEALTVLWSLKHFHIYIHLQNREQMEKTE